MTMRLLDCLDVLKDCRGDAVVVAAMGAAREWLQMSQHERDFIYVPSAMGQAPTLGLGLALARPDMRIVVCNGDGCLLMNLGCLITIADQAPTNYTLLNFDNGVYEVTGGQPTAAAGRVDFAGLATAAGFPTARRISDLESWKASAGEMLAQPGPVFATLDVEPVRAADISPKAPCPMPEQVRRFQTAIGVRT